MHTEEKTSNYLPILTLPILILLSLLLILLLLFPLFLPHIPHSLFNLIIDSWNSPATEKDEASLLLSPVDEVFNFKDEILSKVGGVGSGGLSFKRWSRPSDTKYIVTCSFQL